MNPWNWLTEPLVGGTEPHKFHTCIHRTLRSCKNMMCVRNFIFIAQNLLLPNPWIWLPEPLGFDRTQVENHSIRATHAPSLFVQDFKSDAVLAIFDCVDKRLYSYLKQTFSESNGIFLQFSRTVTKSLFIYKIFSRFAHYVITLFARSLWNCVVFFYFESNGILCSFL